jgi:hypothetical protein
MRTPIFRSLLMKNTWFVVFAFLRPSAIPSPVRKQKATFCLRPFLSKISSVLLDYTFINEIKLSGGCGWVKVRLRKGLRLPPALCYMSLHTSTNLLHLHKSAPQLVFPFLYFRRGYSKAHIIMFI